MFSPAEVAKNAVTVGKNKAALSVSRMLVLGILAGAFIACGAVASNAVQCTVENASIAKLLCGIVFPVGLIMVVIGGSELFTGNALMIIPVLQKELKISAMLKNWFFVYIGNYIGSVIVAGLVYFGGQFDMFGGELAVTTIKVAAAKSSLSFVNAFCLGIMCNFLVCMAVWLSFASKNVQGKIMGLFMPIMVFILCGFEHSVANMYYGAAGFFANMNAAYHNAAVSVVSNIDNLTLGGFLLHNLLPVTLGNIVGGSVLVGCMYWFAYLKGEKGQEKSAGM